MTCSPGIVDVATSRQCDNGTWVAQPNDNTCGSNDWIPNGAAVTADSGASYCMNDAYTPVGEGWTCLPDNVSNGIYAYECTPIYSNGQLVG